MLKSGKAELRIKLTTRVSLRLMWIFGYRHLTRSLGETRTDCRIGVTAWVVLQVNSLSA
jgi:hypothetical protein